jgi:hypothetical protein
MKLRSPLFIAIVLLVIIGSVFRVAGLAPQIAMAVFGAAVIKDKRLAFALPLVSMLISDAIYQLLYVLGYMPYSGFYRGASFYDSQVLNYLLLASLTVFGFWASNLKLGRIIGATLAAPVFYFIVSNFLVWIGGAGLYRPQTFEGLMMCYGDGLPFLRTSLVNTAVFSMVLFGVYFLASYLMLQKKKQTI